MRTKLLTLSRIPKVAVRSASVFQIPVHCTASVLAAATAIMLPSRVNQFTSTMDEHDESRSMEASDAHKEIRDLEGEAAKAVESANEFAMSENPDDELAADFRLESMRLLYDAYLVAVSHSLDEDAERLEKQLNLKVLI